MSIFKNVTSSLGLSAPATIAIKLDPSPCGSKEIKKSETEKEVLSLYHTDDNVSGRVTINASKKVDHIGIKVEFLGLIECGTERGTPYEFTSKVQELASPGAIMGEQEFKFEFKNTDKPHESFRGLSATLKYVIRVTISRSSMSANVVEDKELWVQAIQKEPEINNVIKMEVGIEDCLHIEFEYDKCKYHLEDVVMGKIYFLLVRIKIKHMELAIIRRESVGSGQSMQTNSETVIKYEIMDGAPVKGETIPVRLFLESFPLTPTYPNVTNKFSVKYYLNLVLVDEEDRRYFKQQEVKLWRKNMDKYTE